MPCISSITSAMVSLGENFACTMYRSGNTNRSKVCAYTFFWESRRTSRTALVVKPEFAALLLFANWLRMAPITTAFSSRPASCVSSSACWTVPPPGAIITSSRSSNFAGTMASRFASSSAKRVEVTERAGSPEPLGRGTSEVDRALYGSKGAAGAASTGSASGGTSRCKSFASAVSSAYAGRSSASYGLSSGRTRSSAWAWKPTPSRKSSAPLRVKISCWSFAFARRSLRRSSRCGCATTFRISFSKIVMVELESASKCELRSSWRAL
mmetsp:Transcript_6622/g.25563  ORF Transcript_6622/g.25563 Transcript_6622/m.25563 type:complete len:268 (+) Transcript_6622:364-1167(+)